MNLKITHRHLLDFLNTNEFKGPFVAALIALLLSPFSISLGFLLNNYFSKPILSIEYASRYVKSYLNKSKVTSLLGDVANDQTYLDYRSSKILGADNFDLRTLAYIPESNAPRELVDKITKDLTGYSDYLSGELAKLSTSIKGLPKIDDVDLKVQAFRVLDNPTYKDGDELRKLLLAHHKERINILTAIRNKLDLIINGMSIVDNIEYIKFSVLNKGSSDGLIRNHGDILYNGIQYKIYRVPPPSSSQSLLIAVPTFQVNASQTDYSPRSVGQIVQHTMTEIWFRINMHNSNGLCSKGGGYKVELSDQDNDRISKRFDCAEGGESYEE